jgi:peptide-methionine (S)-S-oxide reductase
MTTYVLGGGCFWCIDAVFRRIKGVEKVESGYAGGEGIPNYYKVATGHTGFAEVVRLTFDETVIPADTILDIFFLIHDPTTRNRQGADEGTQYRSVLFYADDGQKETFQKAIDRAQHIWNDPIVSELSTLETFYIAEDEHQDYFNKNPGNGYCSIVIQPKIVKARQAYVEWFKEDAV